MKILTMSETTPQTQNQNRLWAARKAAGLTQKQVALILGKSAPSVISQWERGINLPTTKDLLRLSSLYHRLSNDLLWPLFVQYREEVNERKRQFEIE